MVIQLYIVHVFGRLLISEDQNLLTNIDSRQHEGMRGELCLFFHKLRLVNHFCMKCLSANIKR